MVPEEYKEVFHAWTEWAESIRSGFLTESSKAFEELIVAAAANDAIAIWTDNISESPRVVALGDDSDVRSLADQLRSYFMLGMGMDPTDNQSMFEEARSIVGTLHQEPDP